MIAIGIVSANGSGETARILLKLSRAAGLRAEICMMNELFDDLGLDIGICCIEEAEGFVAGAFDILLVNEKAGGLERLVATLAHNNVLIMNADNKELYHILPLNKAILITYGYNSKATVTASSVMDSEVQICLQRGLPGYAGKTLEQQEFSVFYQGAEKNMHNLLAAVTAAIVSGIGTDKIPSSCSI